METRGLTLDGSEGGGQLLRLALSLALVTGRPFTLSGFRARSSSPGLRPTHLAYLRAAESLGGRLEGACLGSEEISFHPAPVQSGEYVVDVGAGTSTTLVFQCLFFPLALVGGGGLLLRGGTHLPGTPSYPYLRWVWLAGVAAFGFRASLFLKHAGFAPEGAGEFRALIAPALEAPTGVTLPSRGTLRDVQVTSFVAGLPLELADRQARAAVAALREQGIYSSAENMPLPSARSVGSAVFIRAQFEHTLAGFTAIGERGGPFPEEVGRQAAMQLAAFMRSGGALDEHLADQLLVPAALLAAGRLPSSTGGATRFRAARISELTRSTARVVERFLPVSVRMEEADGTVLVVPG